MAIFQSRNSHANKSEKFGSPWVIGFHILVADTNLKFLV